MLYLKNRLFTDVLRYEVIRFQTTACQVICIIVTIQFCSRTGIYILAVSHDADIIGDFKDFFCFMADEHDSDTAVTQLTNCLEQGVNFFFGQSRCRLIHDDQLCIKKKCTTDGNQLFVSDTQLTHSGVQIDIIANFR